MSRQHQAPPLLLVRAPHGGTRECEITRTPFTIGRTHDNDLCLEDPAVSAHHARIVNIQDVLFLEDLKSTNGSFVNEQPIDRRQLQDADGIRLGAHRLMFRDKQGTATEQAIAGERLVADETIVVPSPAGSEPPAPACKVGIVEILSGKTGQSHYPLTRHVSLIGAQDDAVITLTGWFAPKTAAVISRRGEAYVVSQTESGKRILVNGRLIQREHALRHGDVVEVAGITMRFVLRDERSHAA
ncbi:MAG: FHA domain-containing protein [Nitrospira sp. CR1.1]|nr:FHA domain-containing protein [Nitrospira sp. CR1.1]